MLFVGALFSREEYYAKSMDRLGDMFGHVLIETPSMPWKYSECYEQEIGRPIMRRFIFFEDLIKQGDIADIKLKTIGLEGELSSDGRRSINLDPGYLTLAKVVLATTKDYSHRIYLRDGIHAEITLVYSKGSFHPHINTYREYRDHAGIFIEARKALKEIIEKVSWSEKYL
jgi:hypothetical protein